MGLNLTTIARCASLPMAQAPSSIIRASAEMGRCDKTKQKEAKQKQTAVWQSVFVWLPLLGSNQRQPVLTQLPHKVRTVAQFAFGKRAVSSPSGAACHRRGRW